MEQARRNQELDPESPYANAMAGFVCLLVDKLEDAVAQTRRAVEIAPDSLQANWLLGLALTAQSNWEEANEWFDRAVTLSSRAPIFLGLLAWCQAASGRHAEALQTLADMERRSATEYVSPLFLAWAYSELGDRENTQKLIGEAFTERSVFLSLPQMPFFRKLRELPPMVELRQRLLGQAPNAPE